MSNYEWNGNQLTIGTTDFLRYEILKIYKRSLKETSKIYDAKSKNVNMCKMEADSITGMVIAGWDTWEEKKNWIYEQMQLVEIPITEEQFMKICETDEEELIFEPLQELNISTLKHFYGSAGIREAERAYRDSKWDTRKANKPQWSGGGFGVSGAIKGAVQAGAMNLATSAVYSAGDAISKFSADFKDSRKMYKVLRAIRDAAQSLIENEELNVYKKVLFSIGAGRISIQRMMTENDAFIENKAKNMNVKASKELFENIRIYPYNVRQYEILIRNFGDENNELAILGKKFGVDIAKIKKDLLKEFYRDHKHTNDYSGQIQLCLDSIKFRKKIGEEELDKHEMDEQLYRYLSKESANMSKEKAQELYTATEKLYKKTQIGKSCLNSLKSKLDAIDISERRVHGKVFDTHEEADYERSLWHRGVRHKTLEEVEHSKRDEEIISQAIDCEKLESSKAKELQKIYDTVLGLGLTSEFAKAFLVGLKNEINEKKHKKIKSIITWPFRIIADHPIRTGIVLALLIGMYLNEKDVQTVSSQPEKQYILEDSSSRYLTNEEIEVLSEDDRLLASLEIYARHGVDFSNEENGEIIQEYFEKLPWYEATVDIDDFNIMEFNVFEYANIDMLMNGATNPISNIPTVGDEYFILPRSNERYVSTEEIDNLTEEERVLAIYEIYARYGVDFSGLEIGDFVKEYFEKQPWYEATIAWQDFDASQVNKYEAANLVYLTGYGNDVPTSDTDADKINSDIDNTSEYILPESSSRYLTNDDLKGLDSKTLRLARNEIFARHGRSFEAEDLNTYFSGKSWYNGSLSADEFDDSVFNEYEKANLDLIKEAETGSSFDENSRKELSGLYEMQFDSYGRATLEIQDYSGEDAYYATLSGSYYDAAGFVEGYLSAYTDGSDGIWELYEPNSTMPVLRLIYDGKDFIKIESLNGDSYGGVNFPGFSGTYKRTEE